MTKALKKLFGGIDLTWPKLITAAVVAGVLTAVIALIPGIERTSLHTIVVTFEVWILFGILIIHIERDTYDLVKK